MIQQGPIHNDIQLFLLPLGSPLSQQEWDAFMVCLPLEDQIRVSNYKKWEDRQRALLGTVLIRWLLKNFTELQHVRIARNKMGRPYLAHTVNWSGDFNLSHSGEWIAAALNHQGPVGVDIEKIEPLNEDLVSYALTDSEIEQLLNQNENLRTNAFYELWTMKEAIFKTGLFPNVTPVSLDTTKLQDRSKIHTYLLYADPIHPTTICWYGEMGTVKVTVLNRNDLRL